MAFVSATSAASASATSFLSVLSPDRSVGACVCPRRRQPFSAPFHAAKGPNSAPVVLESKAKERRRREPVPDNFPFEIIDEDGMSVVILRRDYKDEKIEVTVSMPNLEGGPEFDDEDGEGDGESSAKDDEEAEEDDESAGDSSISLKVVVSKDSGPKLEFTCTAFREEITIDDMLIVERTDDDGEEKFPYEGPEFIELPVNVQKGLFKYLEQRGVTLSATNYMHDYMVTKQAQEYIRWMTKLKDFVKQ
ncbi:unnamed protein product [Miscanthus lutarioriparius]|uniref:Mitochondrial glycoprotein family protein n=1 Tax=Miscanthus lutarioriparius TaxID=422564 RepID=A0A811PEA7_9POAL|nr:unnamed protein product [Miscanthus lutarioriparius]